MVKNRVPYYKRGELIAIYKAFPEKERKIIEDFKDYVSIGAGERKLDEVQRSLAQFRDIVDVDFDKITLNDLLGFLKKLNEAGKTNNSSNEVKSTVKRFLKWKFKDWSERFNDLTDIRLNKARNEKRINENTLLTKEDIETIVKVETHLKYKAFFMTLFESGCRPDEIRNLRWKDVKLHADGDLSEVHVFSNKTKRARTSYIKNATGLLEAWKKEQQPKLEDYVFPSPTNKNKCLSKSAVSGWLKKLSVKAIGREAFPYLLRHSRATQLYLDPNIPDSIAQKFMGHSKNMKDTYTHMSSQDVKQALAETVYNFEYVDTKEKAEYDKRIAELEKDIGTLKKLLKEKPTIDKEALKDEILEELQNELTGLTGNFDKLSKEKWKKQQKKS